VDAPLHFIRGGKTIETIAADRLIGPVTIVDLADLQENACVTLEMAKSFNVTARMLFRFGWGKHWGSKKFYSGYPWFSAEASQYLVDQGMNLMAFDTPSPDDSRTVLAGDLLGTPMDSPIHKILLSQDVILVEYLANLDQVKDLKGWTLIALPLRIKGADGSPARVCLCR
jgi:arylformamidase